MNRPNRNHPPHLELVATAPPPWPTATIQAMTDPELTAAEILAEGARHAVAHLLGHRLNEQMARAMLNVLRNHAAAIAEEKVKRRLETITVPAGATLH